MTDASSEGEILHYSCIACWAEDGEAFETDDKVEMRRHQYNEHELTEVMDAAVEVTK